MRRRLALILSAAAALAAAGTGLQAWTSYTSARWSPASATFVLNRNSVTNVTADQAAASIQTAMNAWNNAGSAFRFYLSGGGTSTSSLANDGVNAIFFRQESGGAIASNYTWWDGSNRIIDSDIVFWNYGRVFFSGSSGCSGGYYIEDIAVHELGHAFGLDHTSYVDPSNGTTATMYPSTGQCDQNFRTLSADDVNGIRALYPGGSTSNSAPFVSISSPTNGSSVVDGSSVTFVGSASDTQDGNLTGSLQWTDNGSSIGAGGSFTRVLSGVGTHTIVAYVIDSGGLQGSRSISVNVTSNTSGGGGTGGSGPSLTARGRKVKGVQRVELYWNGASATSIDVYRNGNRVLTTANDGSETDFLNIKGQGVYDYRVCAAGTSTCSNSATVVF